MILVSIFNCSGWCAQGVRHDELAAVLDRYGPTAFAVREDSDGLPLTVQRERASVEYAREIAGELGAIAAWWFVHPRWVRR